VLIFSLADSFHEPCGAFRPALGDASVNRHSCFTATACSDDGEDVAVADARGRLSILARCEPGVCMFCQKPARSCRQPSSQQTVAECMPAPLVPCYSSSRRGEDLWRAVPR